MSEKNPWDTYEGIPEEPERKPGFPTGKREGIFGLLMLAFAMALCNSVLYGGFSLGFSLFATASLICSYVYLRCAGCRPDGYGTTLLVLCIVIAAGFARSDDSFVKFVLLCFLLVGGNLGLCLTAGQNRRAPGSIRSLWDAPRTLFVIGVGGTTGAVRGLRAWIAKSGDKGKKGGAFLVGLVLCIPLLVVMVSLLTSADAAFDGLIKLLPEWDLEQLVSTVITGSLLAILLYSRATALKHSEKQPPAEKKGKGVPVITVGTVLVAVCFVYLVYLLSQLAYLSGGFAGILPEGYTMAEYARRGFFEMACLCGINLTVMVLALGLVRKESAAPLAVKLLCLFVGVVTMFLVATASAKMFMYIRSYGLTRLRVLTQIIMLFIALTTVVVCIWLFVPKMPYMKVVLLSAMVIGAATIWMDVNTQVARYNVDAYLSGKLETVDVGHLKSLGDSAVPQLARLAEEAPEEKVRKEAARWVAERYWWEAEDFREWNYVNHAAAQYHPEEETE